MVGQPGVDFGTVLMGHHRDHVARLSLADQGCQGGYLAGMLGGLGGGGLLDAVLAPHHGGRGASGAAFVAAVAPAHTLVSAGYRNPFGHPHREALARYAASQVWRTDHDGALRLRLADAASVSAWRQTRARYWHGR